jgi:hypothetical protein
VWDGVRGCHYDHEHNDNPHEVDRVFGTRTFDLAGGEISYPWQTFSTAGLENDLKHNGYKWLVRTGERCYSGNANGCITDLRAQVHAIMGAADVPVRFHSGYIEARVCLEKAPTRCGVARTGGWLDTGHLYLDGVHHPLPTDPTDDEHDPSRHHGTRNHGLAGTSLGSRFYGAWYGHTAVGTIAVMTSRAFGPVDPADPARPLFNCDLNDPDCESNSSTMQTHVIDVTVPTSLDTDRNGFVTWSGYTDRYGRVSPTCVTPALDCVPLEFVDAPVGYFQYRDDEHGYGDDGRFDHDLAPAGVSWIRYPN